METSDRLIQVSQWPVFREQGNLTNLINLISLATYKAQNIDDLFDYIYATISRGWVSRKIAKYRLI